MSGPVPRPGIMDIVPYAGGESTVPGLPRPIKLASNECALGPSPRAVQAYNEAGGGLHRYPDGSSEALRQVLAAHHGLDPARIVCGAGSDELICNLCRAYAGPNDEVLYSRHGFLMFAIYVKSVGAAPVAAPEKALKADVEALIDRVTPKTRILFLANPNNPTGSYLPTAALKRLRAGLPESVLLVIDAAYAEYVGGDDYSPGIDLVDGSDNVVMTRTFSKIYGLAGLRLGWAYCPLAIAEVLNRVRGPFNLSAPAQAAGAAALNDRAHIARVRSHNDTWLPWTAGKVKDLDLAAPPSAGNFQLVQFPAQKGRDAEAADAFLKERGIITRRMAAYGLPEALRVTIGDEEEMLAFVEALSEFMS
ncbi:MAG: histidinol-phosphate transaminase [Rhodospirillales bacterium]|jgi:histidinol-phosphate aminotransferase|nr:histidinol-phosphate transaminase [Rhodospirillales bacterium]HJN23030.1 histidinol-phosphate transaminase [Rhodospirillales bacterium]